jgi:hypothetical protein
VLEEGHGADRPPGVAASHPGLFPGEELAIARGGGSDWSPPAAVSYTTVSRLGSLARPRVPPRGEVAEWLIAAVSKTV